MSIERFIIDQGFSGTDIADLLVGVATRLVEEGLPIRRAYLAMPTVNAAARVYNYIWLNDSGLSIETISHDRAVGDFEASPFGQMLANGIEARHWRFDEPAERHYAIFDRLRALGATDYYARLVPFDNPDAPAMRGMACTFSSDRPGGFTSAELARLDALIPLIALASYRMALFSIAAHMLDLYVGLSAGRRVLNGQIRRGDGTTLPAALMIADLRGFTALADTAGTDLIGRLDEHLEAMAEPVVARGGEVLKFLGDGLLAAFPITTERGRAEACAAAVEAAREALSRNEAVNAAHAGETALALDVALHCGDVFYGNIGAAGRLDFTVIGPAVNETSRLEALCATLGCHLVFSASIAESCGAPTRSLGHHALRGLAETREVFTLD